MKKLVKDCGEVRDLLKNGVKLITEPVVQTLSPKGKNVIYEDGNGSLSLTNDGVTIAKQVSSDDPVENAVIEIIKHGALKTNNIAGDGTTTTILYTSVLLNEGWKKIDDGENPMVLKKELEQMGEVIVDHLKPIAIENDEDLLAVATISANNDEQVAKNVVDIVTTAGQDGIVVIEDSPKEETVVEKNTGFIIESGVFSPEYAQDNGFTTTMEDCAVFVTDKRLYYKEEVDTIIRTAIEAGIKDLVVVARDFIGKSVNAFSHNQVNNELINLLLVKDDSVTESNNTSVSDLAIYLSGGLVSEMRGKLVDNIKGVDFMHAVKVYSNPQRTVITPTDAPISMKLESLIDSLKRAKEEDPDDEVVGRRLASLTSGMVTVKVGGATPIEVREKLFRYEDAINATRSAMKDGYLVGGGIGLYLTILDMPIMYLHDIAQKLGRASIKQIARNCGQHEGYVIEHCIPEKGIGYNAKNGKFENMIEAGVIDPYKVTEMAIKNAVSIANSILTAGYIIVNEKEDDTK